MTVSAVTAVAAPAAAQSPRAACLARHYAVYAEAQRDYQRAVERLAVRTDPTVRELAALVRAEQTARIDARERAVVTLLATSPATVRVSRPANEWLDWGPDEALRLSQSDSVFARLERASRAASERVSGHPQWSRLRDVMREQVWVSPEHRAPFDRLVAAMRAAPKCGP